MSSQEKPTRLWLPALDACIALAAAALVTLNVGTVWCGVDGNAFYGLPFPWIQDGILSESRSFYLVPFICNMLVWAIATWLALRFAVRTSGRVRMLMFVVLSGTACGSYSGPAMMVSMGYWRIELAQRWEAITEVHPWLDGQIHFEDGRCGVELSSP